MSTATNPVAQIWQRMRSRERWAVSIALAVVVAAGAWAWLIQPALKTLSSSAALHAQADAQLATMQRLAAQAQAAKATPQVSTDDSLRAMDTLVKTHLGAGSGISSTGGQANVSLKGVNGSNLLSFVQAARVQARALPTEVSLQRSTNAGTSTAVLWDGRLTFAIHSAP